MNVLHIMPSLARAYGGPTQSLLGFLDASHRAGVRTDVVAPHAPDEDLAWVRPLLPSGTELLTFPARGPGHMTLAPALLRHVRRAASRYDAVHVHGVFNLVSDLGARAALAADAPLVVRPFGTLSRYTFEYRRGWAKRLYYRVLEAPTLRRAAVVHFTTETELVEADRPGMGLGPKGIVVPPPWSGPLSPPRPSASEPRVVLLLSRLHPVKAVEALIDAWPRVVGARPGLRLVIAGDGPPEYVNRLRERVLHSPGGPHDIRFSGFVNGDAKAQVFADADLFVLPSFHENFGIAVLEALAAGLPVVVSPDVQLASFVVEHRLGLVSDREPGALANSILSALADDGLRRRCALEGAATIHRVFSPAVIGVKLRELYRVAAERAGASGI
jgi:glycosyltransferase involved in cell wall biosynthesis